MLVIFFTVFIDLIGFGIVVPLVPIYTRDFGAGAWLGVILASFSAMQFVFSPIWGRLSDRYGRRPILLISTAGASLSYVLFALGAGITNHHIALAVLVASRMFAGACGGNIAVAQAYIADITPPENRSKRMGLIGMAFGLGFIFGPIIGGVALKFGNSAAPGWAAAVLCALNFLLAFSILAESLKPDSGRVSSRPHFAQWAHTLAQPKIGLLILVFFLSTVAFSCFESTLALLVNDDFKLGITVDAAKPVTTVIWLFVFCGIISAFIQGGLIGRMVKLMGEPKLIAFSLFLTGAALVWLPLIKGDGPLKWSAVFHLTDLPWVKMLLALALLAIGSGLTRAPVFGMISNLTPANEQGATIGVAQSAGSLARIVGPIFAATLYVYAIEMPYIICGGISVLAGLLAALLLAKK